MPGELDAMAAAWRAAWPDALAAWSRFTRLRDPILCPTARAAHAEGLDGAFAMIRLADQAVVIDLEGVRAAGLAAYAPEILAHEVGHHVYAPADLADHARMLARMRRALPTKEGLAGLVANLYTDLLINDRLQRDARLRLADIYQRIGRGATHAMWTLYMRLYEILWSLPRGTLASAPVPDAMEGDALLAVRVARSFARDWLDGAGRFAALCLPYLMQDDARAFEQTVKGLRDTENAGAGGEVPGGITERDPAEATGAVHPAEEDPDADHAAEAERDRDQRQRMPAPPAGRHTPGGQAREPFEYGEILRSAGLRISDHELAIRYYRERALPHLVPFPVRQDPAGQEPLPEGVDTWDVASPIEDIDWAQTAARSPRVVPGVTTVERTWGVMEGAQPAATPIDLDLYVDSSGSMPNPQVLTSHLALAGAIIALSAFRAGARVQATLWSGKRDFITTGGFIQNAHEVLKVVTGYIGGATAFPIHILRDTFQARKPTDRAVHVLVISDDGVTTMFDKDEQGNSGWDIARLALEKARAGGSLVLNLGQPPERSTDLVRARQQGWAVFRVQDWPDLVAFAREFSRRNYDPTSNVSNDWKTRR